MPSVSAQKYTTPERVWALALPPETLFGPGSNIEPGIVALPTKTAGTGTGIILADGNAHGTIADLRIKCVAAGSINRKNTVNPGALPVFQVSKDGGTTWGSAEACSPDNDTAYVKSIGVGVRWVLAGTTPAFAVGDIWKTSTLPSPTIEALIGVCSSEADRWLIGSCKKKMPLTTWPESLEKVVAELVRWELVRLKGLAADQTMAQYKPDWALGWLQEARAGLFTDDASFAGAGSDYVYPDIVSTATPLPDFGDGRWWIA